MFVLNLRNRSSWIMETDSTQNKYIIDIVADSLIQLIVIQSRCQLKHNSEKGKVLYGNCTKSNLKYSFFFNFNCVASKITYSVMIYCCRTL